jgi:hypothetical protein
LYYTASGLQNGESITSLTEGSDGNKSGSSVGTYAISIAAVNYGSTFNTSNYSIAYVTNSLTVSTASLTIASLSTRKTYGETASLSYTAIGLQNSETITSLSVSTDAAAGLGSVGTYAISITGATGSIGGAFTTSNYAISYVTNSLTISAASLTISSLASRKSYGATASLDYTVLGLKNGESISSLSETSEGNFGSSSVGTYAISIAAVNYGSSFNTSNYMISYATNSLTVTTASLTISSVATTKSYGSTATLSYTASGIQNGETISSITEGSDGNNGNSSVGTYAISITGAQSGGGFNTNNYTISYATNSLTVTTSSLTISSVATTKSYGSTAPLSYTASGIQNGETISSITEGSDGNNGNSSVGTYAISIRGAQSDAGFNTSNYTISYATSSLTVSTASLTIASLSTSKTYGETGNLLYTAIGLQNGETLSTVTLQSNGSDVKSFVGVYAVSIVGFTASSQLNTNNYSISYVTNSLTVTPASLTITSIAASSKTYGQSNALLSHTVVGLKNSDKAYANEDSEGVASTAAAGTYAVTIDALIQSGTTSGQNNYKITYITNSLTVTPASLTISSIASNKTYGQSTAFLSFTAIGLVNQDSISAVSETSLGTQATSVVGSYAISINNPIGGAFTTSNYSISYVTNSLNVTPASLTVISLTSLKTYGQSTASLSYSTIGLVNTDSISSVTETSLGTQATSSVGGYAISISNPIGNSFNTSNYSIAYVTNSLYVTPASLTVTSLNSRKTYGQSTANLSYSAIGLLNGDSITAVLETSAGTLANSNVGSYAISIDSPIGVSFKTSNYAISYVTNSLYVTPASLTVMSLNSTKTYGQSTASLSYSAQGLLNGDSISAVSETSLGTQVTSGVGSYALSIDNPTGILFRTSNYSITYVTNSLYVTPASLTVVALNSSKTYGQIATLSYTILGLKNSDSISNLSIDSTGTAALSSVGNYLINISNVIGGSGYQSSNYTIAYIPGQLSITPKALSWSVANATYSYGIVPVAGFASLTGVLGNDVVSGSVTSFDTSGSPVQLVAGLSVGTYTEKVTQLTGPSATNYMVGSLNNNPGKLTISPTPTPTIPPTYAPVTIAPKIITTSAPTAAPTSAPTAAPTAAPTSAPVTPTTEISSTTPNSAPSPITAAPQLQSVESMDSGVSMFSQISSVSSSVKATNSAGTTTIESSSSSDTAAKNLALAALPPQVRSIAHDECIEKKAVVPVGSGLIEQFHPVNSCQKPSDGGKAKTVPGISDNYSSSGNMSLW